DADRLLRGEALAPCEVEPAFEPRDRDAGRVARNAHLSEELERPPLRVRIPDLGRDRVALLGAFERSGQRAAAEVDGRRGEQRLGAEAGALRRGGEGLVEAPLRLVEVDPAQP